MGCVTGDRHCNPRAEARPPVKRQVEPFWLARTETTIGQYQRCADAGACSKLTQAHPRTHALVFGKCARVSGRPQAPMDCVTWEEAGAFCAWAGGRLPSASEWEYAARSGRDVVYPWGNEPPDGSRGRFGKSDGGPVDVGAYPPTTWGLHDMAGNVSEWTSSAYFGPGRPEDVGAKETRGGSYTSKRDSLGAARRSELLPFMQRPWIGFRCAQDERPSAPPAPSPQGFALPDFQTLPVPELARLVGPGAQLSAAHVGPLENDSRINRITEVSTLQQHELNARFRTSAKPRSRGLSVNITTYYQDLQRGLARGQHVQLSVMDATSNGACQPFEPDQHPGFGKTRVGVFSWSEARALLRACARSGTVRYERNLQGMLTVAFNVELNDGTRLTTDPIPVPDRGNGF